MRKWTAVLMALLFLGSWGMASADTKVSKTKGKHGKHSKGKGKNAKPDVKSVQWGGGGNGESKPQSSGGDNPQ
jgi:hypothetical protein